MTPERREQLQEEREFLLSSLTDLEREFAVGDVADDDYVSLKDSYTARAAIIIRDLSDLEQSKVRKRIGWRPIAWSALVLLLAITAGVVVARNTGERLPGQGMTGAIDDGSVSSLLVQARSMGMADINTRSRCECSGHSVTKRHGVVAAGYGDRRDLPRCALLFRNCVLSFPR